MNTPLGGNGTAWGTIRKKTFHLVPHGALLSWAYIQKIPVKTKA